MGGRDKYNRVCVQEEGSDKKECLLKMIIQVEYRSERG